MGTLLITLTSAAALVGSAAPPLVSVVQTSRVTAILPTGVTQGRMATALRATICAASTSSCTVALASARRRMTVGQQAEQPLHRRSLGHPSARTFDVRREWSSTSALTTAALTTTLGALTADVSTLAAALNVSIAVVVPPTIAVRAVEALVVTLMDGSVSSSTAIAAAQTAALAPAALAGSLGVNTTALDTNTDAIGPPMPPPSPMTPMPLQPPPVFPPPSPLPPLPQILSPSAPSPHQPTFTSPSPPSVLTPPSGPQASPRYFPEATASAPTAPPLPQLNSLNGTLTVSAQTGAVETVTGTTIALVVGAAVTVTVVLGMVLLAVACSCRRRGATEQPQSASADKPAVAFNDDLHSTSVSPDGVVFSTLDDPEGDVTGGAEGYAPVVLTAQNVTVAPVTAAGPAEDPVEEEPDWLREAAVEVAKPVPPRELPPELSSARRHDGLPPPSSGMRQAADLKDIESAPTYAQNIGDARIESDDEGDGARSQGDNEVRARYDKGRAQADKGAPFRADNRAEAQDGAEASAVRVLLQFEDAGQATEDIESTEVSVDDLPSENATLPSPAKPAHSIDKTSPPSSPPSHLVGNTVGEKPSELGSNTPSAILETPGVSRGLTPNQARASANRKRMLAVVAAQNKMKAPLQAQRVVAALQEAAPSGPAE